MAFNVPEDRHGYFGEIDHRFRLLLHKGIITGIDQIRLNAWLANFTSPEDKYLAAHILAGLTYRSDAMVRSSFQHLVHCELPRVLRAAAGLVYPDLNEFDRVLQEGDESCPLRFVAVDGTFEETPGKSGAVVIRQFRRHLGVSKKLLCRPENIDELPDTVKALVFVDDMVGTGRQFVTFAEHYRLASHVGKRALIYCPLMAFDEGTKKIAKALDWLEIHPVETLSAGHRFFRPAEADATLWGADSVNLVADVRSHVADLCKRKGLPVKTRHSLDLVVAFEHAVPNNSMPLLSIKTARWQPLFDR